MSASSPAPRRLAAAGPSTSAIFLVLRRMRAPLIVLITLYAIGILGLTLMPGVDPDGEPWKMNPFQAFYFMSYTATTIGYGELPYPFSAQQRMWVIFVIYMSVIAWAYAIGSILALLQDKGFREALALQRFERRVRAMREPFLILAGFGQAGEVVARSLDRTEHRLVVLDVEPTRIEAVDLAAFRSDVPALLADASNPFELQRAGLKSPHCAGVIALTDDDEANLAITMAAALLRPELPAVCRTLSDSTEQRLRTVGRAMIVDPFNLYGDELLAAIRAPRTHQLTAWLTAGPGETMPPATPVPQHGRWVVAGHGRFGSHLVDDLLTHDLPVTVVDAQENAPEGADYVRARTDEPALLDRVDLDSAAAFAAITPSDTANLALLVEAKRRNPHLFTIGRQNDPANRPLFEAIDVDSVFVPTTLIAHEVLARISDPILWRFVQEAQQRDDAWGAPLLDRVADLGEELPDLWTAQVTEAAMPAVFDRIAAGEVTIGELLRDPQDRDSRLRIVALMIKRGTAAVMAPDDDETLAADDVLLLVGQSYYRRSLSTTVSVPAAASYVLTGQRVGSSWLWRTLAK